MEEFKKKPLNAVINVAQLLKQSVGSSRSQDISGAFSEEVEGFVRGEAKVTRIRKGVLVQCEVTAEVKLECSRCLGTFLCPITFTAEEEFLPIADLLSVTTPSPEHPEGFTIDTKNVVDLSELIRQYILLNLPMKPLCRPDCPGIT